MSYRLFASLVLLVGLGCAPARYIELYPFASSVEVQFEPQSVLEANLDPVPIRNKDRVLRLIEMFEAAGCKGDDLLVENITASPTPNVICTLPGKSDRTIIVSTHHIRAQGGKGIFDAWTSVAMLPTLYSSLSAAPREHTYKFIGFASAPALAGSASYLYLKGRPDRQNDTAAMVWLDFVGLGDLVAWSSRSDPNLFADIVSAAKALDIDLVSRDLTNAPTIHDMSRAFRWFEIPTLYLHSLTLPTERVVGDRRWDIYPETLDREAYFDSYRILAAYLGYLDKTLDARKM